MTLFLSLQYLGIGVTMLMQNLSPFVVSIAQYLYLKERIHFYEFMNMLFCFLVLFVLCYIDGATLSSSQGMMGYVWGFMSTLLFAMTYIVPKQVVIHNIPQYNAISNIFGVMLYVCLTLLQCVYRLLTTGGVSVHLSVASFLYSAVCGVLGFGVSHFFLLATRIEKPSRLASLEFIGVLFGYGIDLLTGQPLSWVEMVCCALLALVGFIIFQTKKEELEASRDEYLTQYLLHSETQNRC